MRMILTLAAPLLAFATASSTMSAGGSMPDPTVEYNQNVDCHNAYDRLVSELNAGTTPSPAAVEWAKSYEAGANAGTPCPAPLPEMTARGGNWYIRTTEGRDAAIAYARKQKDPAALSEIGHAWINGTVAGGTPQEGLALIRQAAHLGDPVALYSVGTLYGAGIIGGKKDPEKALALLNQSAAATRIIGTTATGRVQILPGTGRIITQPASNP